MSKNGDAKEAMEKGQFAEFVSVAVRCLPRDLNPERAQFLIENPKRLEQILRVSLTTEVLPLPIITLEVVRDIYTDLGIECEFPEMEIPQGNVWPVAVPKGMTPAKAFAISNKLFPCWSYWDDLDKAFPDEKAEETAVHFFKANVEADKEWANHSANKLEEMGVKGLLITLTQRILLEVVYFKVTGKHLDIDNITLCAGSRDSDGNVPLAYWHDDKFILNWYDPDDAYSFLRARSAVS